MFHFKIKRSENGYRNSVSRCRQEKERSFAPPQGGYEKQLKISAVIPCRKVVKRNSISRHVFYQRNRISVYKEQIMGDYC